MDQAETLILEAEGTKFTAYAMGPEDGPVALCLHGFPDTPHSWRHQLPALAAAGYRTVAPTLRGYEPSSVGDKQSFYGDQFARDVVGQLDALGAEKAHLISHDWGATIGFCAAKYAPGRFYSHTQMSVPNPTKFFAAVRSDRAQLKRSWYIMFFQLKGISEYVIRRKDFAFLDYLWRKWSPGWAYEESEIRAVKDALSQPGVLTAALNYYRGATDTKSPAAQRTAPLIDGPVLVPTLGITGAQEGCIGADVFQRCMVEEDFPGGLRVEVVAGGGHFVHQEVPETVNALILDWLKQHDAK